MKSRVIITVSDAEKNNLDQAVTTLTDSFKTDFLITEEDKKGGKLFQKEEDGLAFCLTHVTKIEHKLARDFDTSITKRNFDALLLVQDYINKLEAIKSDLMDITTTLRTELKPDYSMLYDAANRAAKEDIKVSSIYEKMNEAHAVAKSVKTEEKKELKALRAGQ